MSITKLLRNLHHNTIITSYKDSQQTLFILFVLTNSIILNNIRFTYDHYVHQQLKTLSSTCILKEICVQVPILVAARLFYSFRPKVSEYLLQGIQVVRSRSVGMRDAGRNTKTLDPAISPT